MADLKTLVEREMDRAGEPAFAFEDLDRLRARRHRTRQVTAAAVGLGLVLVLALVGASMYRSARVPAAPDEPPVDLGIFEPVAGKIVYHSESSLWAVDPNAPSPISTLVRLGAEGRFESFTVPLGWSSDGTKLLFAREDPKDEAFQVWDHLYILHADGTETQVVPGPVEDAAISPDGSQVAFVTDGLYVVDAEGGQPVLIAGEGNSPTFSPDGTRIAYLGKERSARGVTGGREHVWVANSDGTDAHEILADEPVLNEGVFELEWSPAGDRIAMGKERDAGIYTFAPDGSGFTKVIDGGWHPFWSPDGSQIAYLGVCCSGRDGLTIADANGSNVRPVGIGDPGPWHPGTLGSGPRPSPSPGSSKFNSTIRGISIDHPSGWQTRPATEPWNHDTFTFDAPGVDVIFDPTLQGDLYFSLASMPLGGQSTEAWGSELWAAADVVCESGGSYGTFTVDGASAYERVCDGGEDYVVAVATATRGYLIYLHVADDPILRATYNHDWFDAALETVELR